MTKNHQQVYGPKLSRSLAWQRHFMKERRVSAEIFLDVFQAIYDMLENNPTLALEEAADQILILL